VDRSRTQVKTHGNRHTLIIEAVEEKDFGAYTCEAQNQYGQAQRTTVVSGKKDSICIQMKVDYYHCFSW